MATRAAGDTVAMSLSRIAGVTPKGVLNDGFVFQMPPLDEFGWDVGYNWQDYETITGGTYTRDGGRQLRSVSFQTVVLDYQPSYAAYVNTDPLDGDSQGSFQGRTGVGGGGVGTAGPPPQGYPEQVAEELNDLVLRGAPVLLTVESGQPGEPPDLRMPVTIRSLSVRQRGGEPDARYFDFQMTEYRVPMRRARGYGRPRHDLPATVRITQDGVAVEIRRDGRKVRERDRHRIGRASRPATLRALSKHFYGKSGEWKRIAKRNKLRNISGDTTLDKLWERTRRKRKKQPLNLVIPEVEGDGPKAGSRRSTGGEDG